MPLNIIEKLEQIRKQKLNIPDELLDKFHPILEKDNFVEVKCVWIDVKYSHHRKLIIGNSYWGIFSSKSEGINIYCNKSYDSFLGSFPKRCFEET